MDKKTANCGIYEIRIDRPDGTTMYYIGQSVNLHERHLSHLSTLKRKCHKNVIMSRAYEKYGEQAFSFKKILICRPDKEELAMYEQAILNFYRSTYGDDVINLCVDCVTSVLGVKKSPEVIEKIAAKNRGKKMSPEHKAKMIASKKASGWKPSPEHIAKTAAAARGRPMPAHVKEILISALTGKKKSPEEIARRQAKRMANGGYNRTPEIVAKCQATKAAKRAATNLTESQDG